VNNGAAHLPMELLAPAGSPEKLELAVHYGADAVYLAGRQFSLRNFADNFSDKELAGAISYCHARGVKVYVAINIYARDRDRQELCRFLHTLGIIGPDALIVADAGVFALARQVTPRLPIHISTQASTTHTEAALFWQRQGASRVNLARELTIEEITTIALATDFEIEAFVHGAMCISYSGRCLLSAFMERRDGNRGRCCHPCRFRYAVMEEKRPGQYFPLAEDERGAYVFNSRDLCMIDHIPELSAAGIHSLKIEGRMKGIHYLATVLRVYREALDDWHANPERYRVKNRWRRELATVDHRGYCTGFYFGDPRQVAPAYTKPNLAADQLFLGKVVTAGGGADRPEVQVRNRMTVGEEIEVLPRRGGSIRTRILSMENGEGETLTAANPGSCVLVTLEAATCHPNDLLRKRIET
jgi:putative protease